jgi:hypothetical protein
MHVDVATLELLPGLAGAYTRRRPLQAASIPIGAGVVVASGQRGSAI